MRKSNAVRVSPADPKVFVQAGTSGLRHLLPIHLNESNLPRPIVRIRSRTPKTSRATNVETIRQICSTVPTLKQFDISDNTLDELPLELSRLTDLEKLNCANNRLTTLPNEFEQLENLKELNLSFNLFKRLPPVVATFAKLVKLNVEENALKSVDMPLTNLRLLKTLVLDHNQLQSLDLLDFQHFAQLESLHVAQNQLAKFPRNLQRLSHLKIVDLSSNQLTSFPIEVLLINSLDVLNLSHNRLRKLPPLNDIYKRKTLLFSIDFSHNQLMKFSEYLLLICRKLDLSFNQIQSIPSNALDKFSEEMLAERELKIYQNPLLQTNAPADLRNEMNNVLPFIQQFFQEAQRTQTVRQGFPICITGGKSSGKSALTYVLQENLPFLPDDEFDGKPERVVDVHQFAFPLEKPPRKLPVTIFDLNGSLKYFAQLSPFLRHRPLHLFCVPSLDFQRQTPKNIDELFNGQFVVERSSMLGELFQMLGVVFDQATRTHPLLLVPLATRIDETKPNEKNELLAKLNRFFQLFRGKRLEQLHNEIKTIEAMPIISASFSDRLKTLMAKFSTTILIEPAQPVSSVALQGVGELRQTIGRCLSTHSELFPHVDRVLPQLWADTSHYLESLADYLPLPYLSFDNFRRQLIEKDGLANLVDEITLALKDEGKILLLNELGTKEKVVFLRPLWLADLLSSIFCSPTSSESNGIFSSTALRNLWKNLLHKDDDFLSVCWILMRFLLFAYPNVHPRHFRTYFHSNEVHFDELVVPRFLPPIAPNERDAALEQIHAKTMTSVSIAFRSAAFPFGLFDQYAVLLLFRTPIISVEHANDFLFGRHDDRPVTFAVETDHRTYLNIHCGTNQRLEPFDQLWQLMLQFIHHFELLLDHLSPNHQLERSARCPKCFDYSFLGEWNTPKELQTSKCKSCPSCSQSIETKFLVQPNETRRRNEEILRKIRERNSAPTSSKQ